MFVMVNPLQEHWNESRHSLEFATVASQTSMGAAKKNVNMVDKNPADSTKGGMKPKSGASNASAVARRK